MATFLDISLLSGAKAIFSFLLIFCLVYGIFKFTNFLKLSDGMISVISMSLAFLAILSPEFVRVIEIVTPWYMILFFSIVVILVIVMIFGSLGNDVGDIKKNMGASYKTVIIWILVLSLIIMVAGISQVFLSGSESEFAINADGELVEISSGGNTSGIGGKGSAAFIDSLFHPRMLGLMAVLLIGAFAVLLLGSTSK